MLLRGDRCTIPGWPYRSSGSASPRPLKRATSLCDRDCECLELNRCRPRVAFEKAGGTHSVHGPRQVVTMRKGTESWCQYLHPSSLVTSSFTLIQSNSSSKRPDSLQIAAKTLTGPVYMSVVMFGCCPSSIPFFFRQIYNIAFGLLRP